MLNHECRLSDEEGRNIDDLFVFLSVSGPRMADVRAL